MIVGLVGYAQAGKDSAAAGLVKEGYHKVAFADALRAMMARLNPLLCVRQEVMNFYKNPDYEHYNVLVHHRSYEWVKANTNARDFMVALGAGAREILGGDVWINAAKTAIEGHLLAGHDVVITDVRYLNEARLVTSMGGRNINILRPGVEAANKEELRSIDEIHYYGLIDSWVLNDSTLDDLAEKVYWTLSSVL
jgi:hypothetical protein